MRKIWTVLISATILLSGCVQQGPGGTGATTTTIPATTTTTSAAPTTTTSLVTTTTAPQSSECQELEEGLASRFLMNALYLARTECEVWASNNEPIMVGGTLIDVVECTYINAYSHYECGMVFDAQGSQGLVRVVTYEDALPYVVGEFYRFDLGEYCKHVYSAALSGNIVDENFDLFETMDC